MGEELSSGSPYPHRGCKCMTCKLVWDAHNLSPIGTNLFCACEGCYVRRGNKQPWAFIKESPRTERVKKVATINLCEREGCGAMFKSNASGNLSLSTQDKATYGVNLFAGELCPACVGDVMNLLKSAPTESREGKAFSEPWSEDASKSEDERFSSLSDLELAEELIRRRGDQVAKELTARPQDEL